MKWILHIFLCLSLCYPSVMNATAIANPIQQVSVVNSDTETATKKSKPKKKWKKWLKDNAGLLFYGGLVTGSLFMIIFGIIRKIRWLWILGIFGIFGPLILGILFALLFLIFGNKRRPHYLLQPPLDEKSPETGKPSKKN